MGHRTESRSTHQESIARPQHETTGPLEYRDPGLTGQQVPAFVGPSDQRDVDRVLEVSLADDAGLAVGGSEGMRRVKPVEADCADAAAGEIEQGRAPHRAQPDDSDLELLAHVVKRRAFSSRKRCSAR